ncbi:MAG: hypothetical protein J2P36_02985 [Ktedonobacteraceae bacterium]|nr:hypothetical protein [Ktedonobacteraceae bacterium]
MHITTEPQTERGHRLKKRLTRRCAVCMNHVWFDSVHLTEPPGVPEPRESWVLCRDCYEAIEKEVRRSPVASSLRTRIAVGIVASERSPMAYPTRLKSYIYDRRWIVFIAAGCIIAMILHLLLILFIVAISHV